MFPCSAGDLLGQLIYTNHYQANSSKPPGCFVESSTESRPEKQPQLRGNYSLNCDGNETGRDRNSGQPERESSHELVGAYRNSEPDKRENFFTHALTDALNLVGIPIQQEKGAQMMNTPAPT